MLMNVLEATRDLVKAAEDLNTKTEELNTKLRLMLCETDKWPHVRAHSVISGLSGLGADSNLRAIEDFHWRKLRDSWCVCWEQNDHSYIELMRAPLLIRAAFIRCEVFPALQCSVLSAARKLACELDETLSK